MSSLTSEIFEVCSTFISCNRSSKNNEASTELTDTFNLIIYEGEEEKLKKEYLVSDIMPYYSDGLWGYADKEKDIIIKCEYNSCGFFSEGMAWVEKGKKYGYIDTTGVLKIDFLYSDARNFKNGVAPAKRDRYWGFIDSSGNTVTPFLFENYFIDDEGYIYVLQNNQWGTMDKTGKQIISPIYSSIFHFMDGYAIVKRKYKKGVIDKTGNELIECLHNDIIYAGNETFIIIRKPKYNEMYCGLFNNKGEEIIPQIYDELIAVNEKGIIAKKDNLYGLLSYSNDTLIDFVYRNIKKGNTNLLAVKGDKWGFVNLQGDTILPFIYNDAFAFRNGVAKVKKNYKFGVINSKGETIISFGYDKIEDARNNFFRVYKGGKYGFVTTEGKIISECIYDAIDYQGCHSNNIIFGSFINGLSIVGQNSRIGAINEQGKMVVPFNYHYMSPFDVNGISIVNFNNYYGLVNSKGEELTEIKYAEIKRDNISGYYYTLMNLQFENKRYKTVNVGYFDIDGSYYGNSDYLNFYVETEEEKILKIREAYNEIVANLNKYETENTTIDENTSGVKTSDKLTIILKEGITYEYYYKNELNEYGPFFILKSNKQGDETITERFYFEHGKIIRHLNNSGEKQLLCDAMYAPEDGEHYQSRIYYSLFYNAIALQATEINKIVEKNDILANKISTDIKNGLYKKGDCESQSEGEGYSSIEEYLDKDNNRIYYSSEYGGEGGSSSSEDYYFEGKLILSIESETYYPIGECQDVFYYSSYYYEKEIRTYYDNGIIIRKYTTYSNGDITEIKNY